MKRKITVMVAMLTALSLLAVLAFAGTKQENGYTLFKDVLKAEQSLETSGSVTGSFEIKDNGQTLFSLKGDFKGDMENESGQGQLTILADNFEKTLDLYGINQMFYVIDEATQTAYVGQDTSEDYERHGHHDDFEGLDEQSEAILDLVIGDLQHEFEIVEDTDGTLDVKFELTEEEIPAIINLLLSLDDDGEVSLEDEPYETLEYPLFNELEALEVKDVDLENIQLTYLNITLDLDENKALVGTSVKIQFEGQDVDGQNHEMVIEGQISGQALETVEVNLPDLSDYTVFEIEEEHE